MNIETTEELINRLANEVRDSGKLVADLLASVTLERDQLRAKLAEYEKALEDIGVYGCGMLNQPAALNGPEEDWLRKRISRYETVARAAIRSRMGGENE